MEYQDVAIDYTEEQFAVAEKHAASIIILKREADAYMHKAKEFAKSFLNSPTPKKFKKRFLAYYLAMTDGGKDSIENTKYLSYHGISYHSYLNFLGKKPEKTPEEVESDLIFLDAFFYSLRDLESLATEFDDVKSEPDSNPHLVETDMPTDVKANIESGNTDEALLAQEIAAEVGPDVNGISIMDASPEAVTVVEAVETETVSEQSISDSPPDAIDMAEYANEREVQELFVLRENLAKDLQGFFNQIADGDDIHYHTDKSTFKVIKKQHVFLCSIEQTVENGQYFFSTATTYADPDDNVANRMIHNAVITTPVYPRPFLLNELENTVFTAVSAEKAPSIQVSNMKELYLSLIEYIEIVKDVLKAKAEEGNSPRITPVEI